MLDANYIRNRLSIYFYSEIQKIQVDWFRVQFFKIILFSFTNEKQLLVDQSLYEQYSIQPNNIYTHIHIYVYYLYILYTKVKRAADESARRRNNANKPSTFNRLGWKFYGVRERLQHKRIFISHRRATNETTIKQRVRKWRNRKTVQVLYDLRVREGRSRLFCLYPYILEETHCVCVPPDHHIAHAFA